VIGDFRIWGSVNCEEEWGTGDLGVYVLRRNGDLPIWGSARICQSAICRLHPGSLGPASCDAKRRRVTSTGDSEKAKGKGIRELEKVRNPFIVLLCFIIFFLFFFL
jgi:hypothetical protein